MVPKSSSDTKEKLRVATTISTVQMLSPLSGILEVSKAICSVSSFANKVCISAWKGKSCLFAALDLSLIMRILSACALCRQQDIHRLLKVQGPGLPFATSRPKQSKKLKIICNMLPFFRAPHKKTDRQFELWVGAARKGSTEHTQALWSTTAPKLAHAWCGENNCRE